MRPWGAATGFEHINLYVDDRGVSKGLQRNDRACGLTQECGAPSDIVGDAFIARIIDDDDRFERHDFTLAEVSSSAPWVKRAFALNIAKKQNMGDVKDQLKGMTGMNDAAASLGLSDGTTAAAGPDDEDPDDAPLPGSIEEGLTHQYQWTQEGEDVVVTVQAGRLIPLSHQSTTLPAQLKQPPPLCSLVELHGITTLKSSPSSKMVLN